MRHLGNIPATEGNKPHYPPQCQSLFAYYYPVGVDVVLIAWNDVGNGAFRSEVEESVTNLTVGRVERVTDAIERVTDTQGVQVE